MSRKDELYSQDYLPFCWADFWKTRMNASQARKAGFGWRMDGSYGRNAGTAKGMVWETALGPRGGVWIRYRKPTEEEIAQWKRI